MSIHTILTFIKIKKFKKNPLFPQKPWDKNGVLLVITNMSRKKFLTRIYLWNKKNGN